MADIYALLNDSDRFVRWAGRHALEHTARSEWKDRVLKETNPLGLFEGMLAYVRTGSGESFEPLLEKQLAMLKQTNLSVDNKLRLYRTLMFTTAENKGGLTAAQKQQLNAALIGQFPATDERLNREVALMLDRMTGQSRGFCFVEMATPEGAQKALEALNGQDFEGRALRVDVAQERARGGGGGGGNGFRGGNDRGGDRRRGR